MQRLRPGHRALVFTLAALAPLTAPSLRAALGGGGGPGGLEIVYVTDPAADRVWRASEVLVNGNYNDTGDLQLIYDDTVGLVPLTDPVCITASIDDTLYVGDSSERIVLALNDANENGDATESGEHWLFFDARPGGNFPGIELEAIRAVTVNNGQNVVWVASNSHAAGELERIVRLEDLNLDGEANDLDEARVYYAAGELSPSEREIVGLRVGGDGLLYYAENGVSSSHARGVHRLHDANNDGVIGVGEDAAFWTPTLLPGAEVGGLDRDDEETWYLLDRANALVYRGFDADSSGFIDASETELLWTVSVPIQCHDLAVTDEGGVYLGDSSAATRLYFGEDTDASGAVDGSEELEAYSSAISLQDMDSAHGLATDFHAHGEIGESFCSGAVSGTCPCANFGAVGEGCANSTGAGATLEGEGSTGISNDDAAFHAHGMPGGVNALLFQGTLQVSSGMGAPFYDGLRCVGGMLRRFGVQQTDASGESEWGPGLTAQGGWAVGQTLYFQVWYRDSAGPCAQGANLTNGVAVTFDP